MSAPHDVIGERYRLIKILGTGGMGVVWEAWDERLQRTVALKELHPQTGRSAAEAKLASDRAMREARITARLHHPHAVPVLDVIDHDGQPCLIMQYIPSLPLSTVLGEVGVLRPDEAARVGAQVASALAAAHQAGIVHRDVKPGNVLIADDGTALISDFGISHALGDVTLTATGLVHGTPAYLAPEVAAGGEPGYAADVFSLGATLYAALEGTPPFGTDQNSIALLHKVASGVISPPRHSAALTPLLVSMMSKNPSDRPAMFAVARRLADLASQAVTTRAVTTPAAQSAVTAPVDEVATTPAQTSTTQAGDPVPSLIGSSSPPGEVVAGEFTRPTEAAVSNDVPAPAGSAPRQPATRGRKTTSRRVAVGVALTVALVIAGFLLLRHEYHPEASSPPPSSPQSRLSTGSTGPAASPSESATSAGARPSSPSARPAGSPTAATSATPSGASTTARHQQTGSPSAAQLAAAITSYYALMPADLDQAWPRMTASYQSNHAGGRRSYQQFWDRISRTAVSDVTGRPPSEARATVTYFFKNGRVVKESTSYRLVKEHGLLKIADSTVLSSSSR